MDAIGQPSGQKRSTLPFWAGELIIQNGRQSGARRPLQVPLTVVGKAAGCDVRLNAAGIEPQHCLLVHGPAGLLIRDLDSAGGTFLNGERVTAVNLKDGDLLTIGAFQFRLHLPPRTFSLDGAAVAPAKEITVSDQDALRLQASAVAAQQAALGEEEARLLHRKASLERQEEQLASHLEEKRRKLLALHERAHAERLSLQKDRQAYEAHLEKITGDLTQSQREVLDTQERLWAERRRLAELYRRLRRRLHQQWNGERERLKVREEELTRQAHDLDMEVLRLREREQKLEDARLEFNGEYVTGRHQLKLGWQRLRQAQHAWRQRRAKESLILKNRERELAQKQLLLAQGQQQLEQERQDWIARRGSLGQEIDGLDTRNRNQRHRIIQQQLEINRLDTLVRQRQEAQGESTALVPIAGATILPLHPSEPAPAKAKGKPARGNRHARNEAGGSIIPVEIVGATVSPQLSDNEIRLRDWSIEVQHQLGQMDRLAGDLADQRLLMLEQSQRLIQSQLQWDNEHTQVANDLEVLAQRLQEHEQSLSQRERAYEQGEHQFRLRHRELTHLRQHLVAWRARLKTRENALEGERAQLLTEVHHREDVVRKHLEALAELRRRWSRKRRQDLARQRTDSAAYNQLVQDCQALRQSLLESTAELEENRRKLIEKSLALEQYRQELFVRIDQPEAQRRVERLRRRWLTENAAALRNVAQEREALQAELAALQARQAEWVKRQQQVTQEEHNLADKQTAFEHQQALAAVKDSRLEQELHSAESQRQLVEEQLGRMKEEIERIARQLIEEPGPAAQAA